MQKSCSSRVSKNVQKNTTHGCHVPPHRQGMNLMLFSVCCVRLKFTVKIEVTVAGSKRSEGTPLHAAHAHERIGKHSRTTFPPTSNAMSRPGVNNQLFTEASIGGSLNSRSQQASDDDKATHSTRDTHITDMHNVMYPTQGSSECTLPADGGHLAIEPQVSMHTSTSDLYMHDIHSCCFQCLMSLY